VRRTFAAAWTPALTLALAHQSYAGGSWPRQLLAVEGDCWRCSKVAQALLRAVDPEARRPALAWAAHRRWAEAALSLSLLVLVPLPSLLLLLLVSGLPAMVRRRVVELDSLSPNLSLKSRERFFLACV
jgi:hypothetical protein